MPEVIDQTILIVAGAALLTILAMLWVVGRARRQAATLGEELARLRPEAERAARLDAELRAERDGHAAARADIARLAETERRLEAARDDAIDRIEAMERRHDALSERYGKLDTDHARLQADTDGKLAQAAERIEELKALREEMSRRFEELAGATLRRTGAEFQKTHEAKLTELLTPLRDHVGRFETELRAVHKSADEERARLKEQIGLLTARSDAIQEEAANLTRALKGDKQRQGAWGEMILERLLEDSGLIEGTHYVTQGSRTDEEGRRWRPDVVVKMPRGKALVVDSKVSLNAYEAAVNAPTEEERARHLRAHVAAVRKHIDTLADKGYHALDSGSVDYVLMFMPIEGALSAAWAEQGDLTQYAVSKGIGIMTPTTLMVTLRTVDHIWTVERRESNAEAIAERAGRLYDKVAGFVVDMEKVGNALSTAARAHEGAMSKLSSGGGNVLRQVEMLKSMGARTNKTLGVEFDAGEEDAGGDGEPPAPAAPLPAPAASDPALAGD